jgi:hypothetical protein
MRSACCESEDAACGGLCCDTPAEQQCGCETDSPQCSCGAGYDCLSCYAGTCRVDPGRGSCTLSSCDVSHGQYGPDMSCDCFPGYTNTLVRVSRSKNAVGITLFPSPSPSPSPCLSPIC